MYITKYCDKEVFYFPLSVRIKQDRNLYIQLLELLKIYLIKHQTPNFDESNFFREFWFIMKTKKIPQRGIAFFIENMSHAGDYYHLKINKENCIKFRDEVYI